jgi:hypothetical protein
VISLADDSLILFFNAHVLSVGRGFVSLLAVVMAVGVYAMIGLTPVVPKRLLLPIPAFYVVTTLAVVPVVIYWYDRIQVIAVCISACQVVLAFALLHAARRGSRISWPWVAGDSLGARSFTWRNLAGFVVINIFVVAPAVTIYVFVCAAQAVGHFSEGFMALHPAGFAVQVRRYVRDDGKTIELFPMAHVANASFYQDVSRTFPSNSIVLMEGVSDKENLLTNKISYRRMAKSLGLSEQKEAFEPHGVEVVAADVDVSQFSKETLGFLNLVMLIHARGMTPENVSRLLQYSPPPGFENALLDDLLRKRNEHLWGEIQAHLGTADELMVPWGVAHMPGLAKDIEKSGFRLADTRELRVIRFWGRENEVKTAKP